MITGVDRDPAARTLTLVSEFAAPPAKVWRMWDDPRRLERWWGPPTHPVTVVGHDLRPGGRVSYYATFPDGGRRDGWWEVHEVDPPAGLAFAMRDPDLPAIDVRVTVTAAGAGTRMAVVAGFPTGAAMDRLIGLGFAEGMSAALAQIDALLPA